MYLQLLMLLTGGRVATKGRTVEQQVIESNPILEAFVNAKTVRNNNSSPFGKFVEIQFDKNGRISGAAIRTYLLERSRVCQVNDPERNYHYFYLLCAALQKSKCFELANISDARKVVADILHLGNIAFTKGKEVDSSFPKDDKTKFHLKTTAELLMCDLAGLEDALVKCVMITRDGLAKTIYSRLFDWLVDKINNSIGQDATSKCLIGVLDIYCFGSFKTNSFEQFCINFTNEKLQQHLRIINASLSQNCLRQILLFLIMQARCNTSLINF
ncbi:hypothetical protein AHAS_Ahas12G0138000 [Arachis hypogaea]